MQKTFNLNQEIALGGKKKAVIHSWQLKELLF